MANLQLGKEEKFASVGQLGWEIQSTVSKRRDMKKENPLQPTPMILALTFTS